MTKGTIALSLLAMTVRVFVNASPPLAGVAVPFPPTKNIY
jgi:hypothetical protein